MFTEAPLQEKMFVVDLKKWASLELVKIMRRARLENNRTEIPAGYGGTCL